MRKTRQGRVQNKTPSSDRLYAGTAVPCQTDPLLDNDRKVRDHFAAWRKLGNGRTAVADSEERLQSILAVLEECQTGLVECASAEAAHLLALAILEIRIKLNRVSDLELKALCDAIIGDHSETETAQERPLHRQRWRPVLKVVK